MKVFTITWACILRLLTLAGLVSSQGAIQDAARKNTILLAEAKMEAAARLSTMYTSIVISTPTAPALAPMPTDMVAADDIPGYWDNSFWQAEYFCLLHSLGHGHTRSSSNASSPSTYTSSSQRSSHGAASDFPQEGARTCPQSPFQNSLLARINRLELACLTNKLKNCRLSKNWRAQEALEGQKSGDKRRDFYRNLWCESEKDRFKKVFNEEMGNLDKLKMDDKSEKKAFQPDRLKASLEAEKMLVTMGCAISKRTRKGEWSRWDLIRSGLNPSDYESKFPGWAGFIVGFVVGLLMTVGVVSRCYALGVWKMVYGRITAHNAREVGQVGAVRVRPTGPREGGGGWGRGREDRPPPYAALERPPPAYVEIVR